MDQGTSAKVRIFLVDDHPLVRDGIRSRLQRNKRFQVLGEAADAETAIEQIVSLRPDVVIMDIGLPGMNGIEATALLRQRAPEVKVIALTMHEDADYIQAVIEAGAKGYLLKRTSPSEMVEAIETVHRGEPFFSGSVSKFMLKSLFDRNQDPEEGKPDLSPRELEVLSYIADGLSGKEIAARLHISPRTVEAHRDHIMAKLDIHNTAGLTKYAIKIGLVELH